MTSNVPELNDLAAPLCVLLLEGDTLLRDRVLAPKLVQFGFEVMTAAGVTEMYGAIDEQLPDIIMLDVALPDGDGFDVARQLRADHTSLGIVMLSGRSEISDLVRGLSEGADAYLFKPVEMDVLVATLYSLARRLRPLTRSASATWRLSSDEWLLLSPAGGKVRLSRSERRLLVTLMKQPNEVVLRESLIAALTDDGFAFDYLRVNTLIYRLRRKVRVNLGEPLPLDVVHGTGFVLSV